MSDINLDFTVNNNSINFTVEPNQINITPTDMVLTFNPNFQPLAGGSPFELQFNNAGILGGVANSSYASGNLTLGDVSNVKITGGTNGYVLQTDGAGNLNWTAQTGGGGNGTPGGSNTQIQYNDNGTFGGNTGFTFNEVSGNVAIPGNLSVVGNITANYIIANLGGNAVNSNYASYAGNVTIGAQPNITSTGTLTGLTVAGNILGSVLTSNVATGTAPLTVTSTTQVANLNVAAAGLATYATTANAVAGANVSGTVANATYAVTSGSTTSANTAGTVTTNAQPNITSVGTLANLTVTGNSTFNSPIFIESGSERFTANTNTLSGTVTLDITSSGTLYYISNNASGNITVNITNISSAAVANSSVVATFIYTNGANAYSVSDVQLNGNTYAVKWAGATPPTAYASSTMIYTFTILQIGGVGYDILGTGTRYA